MKAWVTVWTSKIICLRFMKGFSHGQIWYLSNQNSIRDYSLCGLGIELRSLQLEACLLSTWTQCSRTLLWLKHFLPHDFNNSCISESFCGGYFSFFFFGTRIIHRHAYLIKRCVRMSTELIVDFTHYLWASACAGACVRECVHDKPSIDIYITRFPDETLLWQRAL